MMRCLILILTCIIVLLDANGKCKNKVDFYDDSIRERICMDSITISDTLSVAIYYEYNLFDGFMDINTLHRELVVWISGKSYIFSDVFDDNLLNVEYLERTSNNGFLIGKERGQACKFDYQIHIELIKNRICVRKISLRSKCPVMKERKRTIKFKKNKCPLMSFDINIIETYKNKYGI